MIRAGRKPQASEVTPAGRPPHHRGGCRGKYPRHGRQCKTRRNQERFHRRGFLCVVKRSAENRGWRNSERLTTCIAQPVGTKSYAVVTATVYIPNNRRLRRAERVQ